MGEGKKNPAESAPAEEQLTLNALGAVEGTKDESSELKKKPDEAEAGAGEKTDTEISSDSDLESDDAVESEIETQPEAESELKAVAEPEPTTDDSEASTTEATASSVAANTHAKKRKLAKTPANPSYLLGSTKSRKWPKYAGFVAGFIALVGLVLSGVLSQYFKGKTLPNVVVAGIPSGVKTKEEVKKQLEDQYKNLKIVINANEKKLEPTLKEVGFSVDIESTLDASLKAKRDTSIFSKLAIWRKTNVDAVIVVNDTLMGQYIETKLPELSKPAKDSQLQYDAKRSAFVISEQSDGEGPNLKQLKTDMLSVGGNFKPATLKVGLAKKKPQITRAKLEPLVKSAEEYVSRKIILSGQGFTFQASPAEIANWITPTPTKTGDLELVVDPAKIQSYVEGLGKRISSPPVDRKVIKDPTSGAEVVLQPGRNGTELADRQALANAIAEAIKKGQGITQTMDIQTAAFKTVSMESFDKWIEVDLSEQRTTAYERTTPIKSFIIASGMRGYETVTGEFAIWLKTRKQTMQGGSKADGSYYSIPNVEWVSYFYKDYALHGAWWRERFGAPASHGCVNMTNADAQWVFEWAPVGTKVIVHQ